MKTLSMEVCMLQEAQGQRVLQTAAARLYQSFWQDWTPLGALLELQRHIRRQLRPQRSRQPLQAALVSSCRSFLQIWTPSESVQ